MKGLLLYENIVQRAFDGFDIVSGDMSVYEWFLLNYALKFPAIETHPYPTSFYMEGNDFLNEISKDSIEILPITNVVFN